MGSGVSTTKQLRSSVIASQDLIDGSNYLFGDVQFRAIFISFVKSGEWVDFIPHLFPDDNTVGCVLRKYQFASGPHVCGLDGLCGVPISPKFVTAKSTVGELNAGVSTKMSFQQQHSIHVPESCITVADCTCFTAPQLIALLFSVLYPIFVSMPEGESGEESTARLFKSVRVGSPPISPVPSRDAYDPSRKDGAGGAGNAPSRARTVLQACAAHFDEAVLMEELVKKSWVTTLAETFEAFPVGLTVSNTGRAGSPFVYCNAAFESLCGYTRQEIGSNNIDFLNGEATEEPQIKLIQEAMRHARPVDVAITHYHKKKRAYVCLVSIKPSGNFSIAAYYPVAKGMRSEDLKVLFVRIVCIYNVQCAACNGFEMAPRLRNHQHSSPKSAMLVIFLSFLSECTLWLFSHSLTLLVFCCFAVLCVLCR